MANVIQAGQGAAPRSGENGSLPAVLASVRSYALALALLAAAVGLTLTAEQFGIQKLELPLFLMAIAAAVWYCGPGPGATVVVAAVFSFDYFFTEPRYSFEIHPSDRPLFVSFALFAVIVSWFAAKRRAIERDLRQTRDRLQEEVTVRTEQASLLDLTRDSILVRDMNDIITYWNRGAQELYGWTREQALGQRAQELLRTSFPMSFDEIQAELLHTGRWEGELSKTRVDGTPIVVACRWSLVRDDQGRPVSILDTNNDITERKRGEERIRRLNADLERRTLELEASNKELEAFAYSTSHDLRAPLRHVVGYSELLQKNASSQFDEKNRRYVRMVLESARRMGTLIDDLLAFSRIGRAETRNTLVSLEQLAQEVVSELERDTEGRTVVWKIGALPSLYGDRAMLRVALVNLISNAIKFTRTRPQAEIEIGCSEERKDEVVVYVRDNGVGFDMKYVNKLFGVFQRLHGPEAFEGTGIGLATVQRIMARHGGRVWAEGEVDRGATFYFSAPKP